MTKYLKIRLEIQLSTLGKNRKNKTDNGDKLMNQDKGSYQLPHI